MKTEYKIITEDSSSILEEEINLHLKNGWTLWGGPQAVTYQWENPRKGNMEQWFLWWQALIKVNNGHN